MFIIDNDILINNDINDTNDKEDTESISRKSNNSTIYEDDTVVTEGQELWFEFEEAISEFKTIVSHCDTAIRSLHSIESRIVQESVAENEIIGLLEELHRKSMTDITDVSEMTFGERLLEYIESQEDIVSQ